MFVIVSISDEVAKDVEECCEIPWFKMIMQFKRWNSDPAGKADMTHNRFCDLLPVRELLKNVYLLGDINIKSFINFYHCIFRLQSCFSLQFR